MNGHRESDRPIVPRKSANNGGTAASSAERAEGRGLAKENPLQQNQSIGPRANPDWQNALERIRQAAQKDKDAKFTALWHHVANVDRLRAEYYALKRDSAPGVDGQTWQEYGQDLETNLQDLSGRLHRGAYHAKPVKRAWIPKSDGRQRPIGVPTLEDKIVQRSAVAVMSAVYEADFKGFSYGFRPGRGPHDALDALTVALETRKVNWVLDADIRGFFDTLSHEWLVKFVEHRIADRRVIRHIKKWLNAGVLEEGRRIEVEEGTPQGGSISPLLANIYLHYVLDLWADHWRRTRATGDVIIVRYADDFVVGFEHQHEAQQFLAELGERFAKFNLELHPDKTRLIEFGRWASGNRIRRGERKPESFNFLGFTHSCSTDRRGRFIVLRLPMAKRVSGKIKSLSVELRRRMHAGVAETGRWLRQVVQGHYRYYGVPRAIHALEKFRKRVFWQWHRMLNRRSQKGYVRLERMIRLADRWLPRPRICHPYPDARLRVRIQGRSPVR